MITVVDSSRAEMLSEVRAKREMALRSARNGDLREEEYWLRIAGRMTEWIAHLEEQNGGHPRAAVDHANGNGHIGIELPGRIWHGRKLTAEDASAG